MKYGGALAKLTPAERYCYCPTCAIVWQDDNPLAIGSIQCPNRCGLALIRGLTREQACEKLGDEHKELLR